MKTLVLAEKPSAGRDIARVLGCRKQTRSFIEGDKYIVTWAMGHLVELADPGTYDSRYNSWNLDDLPMLPERMKHHVIKRTSSQFSTVKKLLHRNDVADVVIATDAGREGEQVARLILRLAGYKGKFSRLWINSLTDKAIKNGFGSLKPGHDFDNLLRAAECRAEADWIIGLNITRALSCHYDTRLSAGRVQTPTLAMVKNREEQIKNFIPSKYWNLEAGFGSFSARWRDGKGNTLIKTGEEAEALKSKLLNSEAEIISVKSSDKTEPPPLAYDLNSLQQEANRVLGFSAKKTLQVLQGLYERHKIVTYPRTDSRYLPEDIRETISERLSALKNTGWKKQAHQIGKNEIKAGKRLFNNAGVSDHHAIIPTEETVIPERLSAEEKALWDIVVKRFIAVLSPPFRYKRISVEITAGGESFRASSNILIDQGWKAVEFVSTESETDEAEGHGSLKDLQKGDTLSIKEINISTHLTKPPAPCTEAVLLGLMEDPSKFLRNSELKENIRKAGLGTPATRADIIEKLISNHYLDRKNKILSVTPAGEEVLLLAPDELKSPELTARWEQRLENIAEGREKAGAFSAEIREQTKKMVSEVISSGKTLKPAAAGGPPCPLCGRPMMSSHDKKGREIKVCRSLTCGYEEEPENRGGMSKPSKREKAVARNLMKKYSADSGDTFTLADMIKEKPKRNRK